MTSESGTEPGPEAREQRAERLKERIYLIFTALAVLLALDSHGAVSGAEALRTLAVTAGGMLLAIFVADVVSHIVVHERPMSRVELRHAASVSFGAVGALVLPLVLLVIAAAGWWEPASALRAAIAVLVVSLVVIGYVAVRRLRIAWWQRLLALGAEAVLGLAVIGLELLAHG